MGQKIGEDLSVIKILTKRFGKHPKGYNDKIMELNNSILDLMITNVLAYKSLEDVKKYFD